MALAAVRQSTRLFGRQSVVALFAVGSGRQQTSRKGGRTAVWTIGLLSVPLAVVECEGKESKDSKSAVTAAAESVASTANAAAKSVNLPPVLDRAAAEVGNVVNKFLETGVGGQMSWGFVSGYCAGFAAKKMSKMFAVGVGTFFIIMQGLSYSGYVNVDYNKIGTKFEQLFDLNKDGKVDGQDLEIAKTKALEVLQYNMPAGGGFVTGLVLGVRSG